MILQGNFKCEVIALTDVIVMHNHFNLLWLEYHMQIQLREDLVYDLLYIMPLTRGGIFITSFNMQHRGLFFIMT